MKEKFLPIGTVVTLNGGSKRIMVMGYLPMDKENKIFDYSACPYPEGMISTDKTLAFNHEQIETINFMGLEDQEQSAFDGKLKDMINSINTIKNMEFSSPENNKGQNVTPQTKAQTAGTETLELNAKNVNSIEDIMGQ